MNTTNTLGIRIAGITLVVALLIFGLWKGSVLLFFRTESSPSPNPTAQQPVASLTPQATIPPQLQEQVSSFSAAAQNSLGTYTKKYLDSLPPDAEKAQVLNQQQLEQFVTANKGTLLPELAPGVLKISNTSGKTAIQKYLDAISPVQNKEIHSVTGDIISAAFQKQMSGEDMQAIAPIRASIEKNIGIFQTIEAPKEAEDLHKTLLQATTSLLNNIALLQAIKSDLIGGLIGQKNIADLDPIFADIEKKIVAFETKYGIK